MLWESPGSYVVFTAFVIFAVLWVLRRRSPQSQPGSGPPTGLWRRGLSAYPGRTERTPRLYVAVIAATAFAAALFAATRAFAQRSAPAPAESRAVSARDAKSGFGRPESITGTLTAVIPEEGLVVVVRRGPGEPPSTELTGTREVVPENGRMVVKDSFTATPAEGETDYSFKVGARSAVELNGRPASLSQLASLGGAQATVRFIPERSGNYTLSLDVKQ